MNSLVIFGRYFVNAKEVNLLFSRSNVFKFLFDLNDSSDMSSILLSSSTAVSRFGKSCIPDVPMKFIQFQFFNEKKLITEHTIDIPYFVVLQENILQGWHLWKAYIFDGTYFIVICVNNCYTGTDLHVRVN